MNLISKNFLLVITTHIKYEKSKLSQNISLSYLIKTIEIRVVFKKLQKNIISK